MKPFISGIDLDIEEFVDINNVKRLINQLKQDFPHFKLSMAPVSGSMMSSSSILSSSTTLPTQAFDVWVFRRDQAKNTKMGT